ncbi:MAG: dihydropteroate synthase [Nakamurella sp.]
MTDGASSPARPYVAFAPQPWVMGILNVTPDSFSDGGLFATTVSALEHGRQLVAEGADLVDVGGESTRPGAHRVPIEQELARVLPVITELAGEGIICSVDTTRAAVAEAAIEAGAALVNDVSGGLADPRMAAVVAAAGVPWVLMHWRGHSAQMAGLADYRNVVTEVRDELLRQVERALRAGVDERALVLDPGLGFAKSGGHNWTLLAHLEVLVELGLPVLVGTSRKRFLGDLLADADAVPRPPAERDVATAVTSALAGGAGVWGVRVHAPRPTRDALAVAAAVRGPGLRRTPSGDTPSSPLVGDGPYEFGRVTHG